MLVAAVAALMVFGGAALFFVPDERVELVDLFEDGGLGRTLVAGSAAGDPPIALARTIGSAGEGEPDLVATSEAALAAPVANNDIAVAAATPVTVETAGTEASSTPEVSEPSTAAISGSTQSAAIVASPQQTGPARTVTPTAPVQSVAETSPSQPARAVTPTQPAPAAVSTQPTQPANAATPIRPTEPVRAVNPPQSTHAPVITSTAPPTSSAPAEQVSSGPWCQVEVRADDGVIRWNDDGKDAVLRRNGDWLHTPDERALAVLIPERVDTSDSYTARLWGSDGNSQDVACTFAGTTNLSTPGNATEVIAAPPTTRAPTTTQAPTTTARSSSSSARLPTPIAIPGGPVQFGFNVDLWAQDRTDYWNELEAVPGNGRLIAHEFKSFNKRLDLNTYRWHMNQGRDLLLTWNGTDASKILNGSQDGWIREHARALKGLPGTVMLRFWHEPDVSYKIDWVDGDPQNFIDSWLYVREIFVEEGAVDNIEWVWCPTAWNWQNQGARFYPGDANVDWICADGYSGWDHDRPLPEIVDAFTDFQAWADQHPTKPILIAEFGATRRGPGVRADWVEGIRTWVNASRNIRAVVYFDFDRRPQGEDYNWQIRTEPDAWQAIKDVLSSAPFGR